MAHGQMILLAEDDENDVILLRHAFAEAGLRAGLHIVKNGAAAMQYLKGEGAYADRRVFPFPSLLLLDWKMAPRSGLEVLRWMQGQPGFRSRLVVVVLTGTCTVEVVTQAYVLGANSVLEKPLDFPRLVALAERLKEYWLELNQLPADQPDFPAAPGTP